MRNLSLPLFLVSLLCSLSVFAKSEATYSENPGSNVGRASNFIAGIAVRQIQVLQDNGIKILLCEFSDRDGETIVSTSDLRSCIAEKLFHDLQYEDQGELSILVSSQGQRVWGSVVWKHSFLRKLTGKTGLGEFFKSKWLLNWKRFLSEALDHNIELTFVSPIPVEFADYDIFLPEVLSVEIALFAKDNAHYGETRLRTVEGTFQILSKTNLTVSNEAKEFLSELSLTSKFFSAEPLKGVVYFYEEENGGLK